MTASTTGKQWFGHPRGLSTLFFTEMWERFSYYGMRALLILFMTAPTERGGLGFDVVKAGAIYGLYTAAAYLMTLPGGFLADRLIGQRKAVLWGGVLIALGNLSLAVQSNTFFYVGLFVVALGTGLLKPNVSTMVGELYPEGGARRDAGFSVFYMGINVGALVAPLISGYIGERIAWRLAFVSTAVGMAVGLVQYLATSKYLGEIGLRGSEEEGSRNRQRIRNLSFAFLALMLVGVALLLGHVIHIPAQRIADAGGTIILGATLAYFAYALFFAGLDKAEKKRMVVIFVLFVVAAIFWSGFEQAGSSLNLFAERLTDRHLLGWDMPASWLQSVNSIFIILLAPLFGAVWVWLDRRRMEPSAPMKFVLGPLFLGLGFLVMMLAARRTEGGATVGLSWLTITYLLHTVGELCLSPVGLSTVTKLAPHKMVGQMMGIWFMAASLGNLIAGRVGGFYESMPLPSLFGWVGWLSIGAAVLLLLIARPVTRMMGGVR